MAVTQAILSDALTGKASSTCERPFRVRLASLLRYLYFLRFSLFLWVFAPGLCLLNMTGGRTLTSGILVPEYWGQYACVSFFVITSGFVALIIARIVVINGGERFDHDPPARLKMLLANDECHLEFAAVLVALVPTLLTFVYMLVNSQFEGVSLGTTSFGLAVGAVLAGFFWWVINAAFYATYRMPAVTATTLLKLGENAARTILLPRVLFWLPTPGPDVLVNTSTIEGAKTILSELFMGFQMRVGGKPGTQGYLCEGRPLYEGHSFSLIASSAFLFVYLALWPMTAPVPAIWASLAAYLLLMVLPGVMAMRIFWLAVCEQPGPKWRRKRALFVAFIAGFLISVPLLYFFEDAERFPTFALILIFVIMSSWFLSALAFSLDRYRVPVMTAIVGLILLPRVLPTTLDYDEHYLSVITGRFPVIDGVSTLHLLNPAQILERKLARMPDDGGMPYPLIVVTATGGGLHASAWTASVLSQLEEEFVPPPGASKPDPLEVAEQNNSIPFHSRILLASTVSGGSVGLYSYLHEIAANSQAAATDERKRFDRKRVVNAAGCSSLEAVGWGLVYYDLPKLLFPWLHQSPGLDDLHGSPLFKDRTWALRKGFERNLNDRYCELSDPADVQSGQGANLLASRSAEVETTREYNDQVHGLTLGNSVLTDKGEDPADVFAFSMNTTAVEGGARFLLSNYGMDHVRMGGTESYPAESFLGNYGYPAAKPRSPGADKAPADAHPEGNGPFDLPLASAAQLSATFPYVSSAARIPSANLGRDDRGLHFVDGGYYDNDGTATAIEFLRFALANRSGKGPVRIVLVEIRNSPDSVDDAPVPPKGPWGLGGQLGAPPAAFWAGGHESATERDRIGLDLLMQAFPQELELKRIVIDDKDSSLMVRTDPLNWSLTPEQRLEVQSSARNQFARDRYKAVKAWFYHFGENWQKEGHPAPGGSSRASKP